MAEGCLSKVSIKCGTVTAIYGHPYVCQGKRLGEKALKVIGTCWIDELAEDDKVLPQDTSGRGLSTSKTYYLGESPLKFG